MEKLKMHTPDLAEENYKKLAALFPDAVTETKDENGNTVRAIDKDVLMQEINAKVVDDSQERYQFTWPDKRKAVVLANAPIAKTLRFEKEKSVGRDGTPGGTDSENIYIEGDNLDALKLLQETYLGKVKMIYIDPPYNTGNDFIYEDDFSQKAEDYAENSGQTDEEGNRLVQNSESNGRFHTDWLNMMYPRLRIAKDLLSEKGSIFISIDNNEIVNLKKICDDVFGEVNCIGIISNTNNPKGRSDDRFIATSHEYLLVYAKNISAVDWKGFDPTEVITKRYNKVDNKGNKYREIDLRKTGENDLREDRPNLFYYFYYSNQTGDFYPDRKNYVRDGYIQIKPQREDGKEGNWRWGIETSRKQINDLIPKFMPSRKVWGIMQKDYLSNRSLVKPTSSWMFKDVNSERGTENFIELGFDKRVFPKPKPLGTVCRCIKLSTDKDDLVLDFFSGSATTAQAVFKINNTDGQDRRFILVQLPEETNEKSEAYKSGYKTICDIGEERIRRAGKKIKEETGADIDYGFRCFRVDSSNMKDVYYKPSDVKQGELDLFTDNIKEDRTPEDLLIQVMLDLGVLLSSKVEEEEIAGKKVFSVADGYLIACFDRDVTDDVVTAIARKHPFYAVFRDSSFSSDSVAANFEQIFDTYSPQTVRKVL